MKKSYDHSSIEKKWQREWKDTELFTAPDTHTDNENYYALVEFPYPSGDLHVGHWYAFAVTDIYVRYMRAQGKNVMFPIGFDAFGLPAENAAIKHGKDPEAWTIKNMEDMKTQLGSMGASFDWSRVIASCDPRYYKWTQWIMTQFFENNLMYQKEAPVNWCDSCKTVLANEQVVNGHCERCDTEVIQKQMKQWMLKITDYADRLIDDLEKLNWPEEIKTAQKNWIGRSQGVNFKCTIKDLGHEVEMYNSVPQTFHAETFTVIAPEHPLVEELIGGTEHEDEVRAFVEVIKKKKQANKFDAEKDMDGIFTGRYIENFAGTGRDLPIWIASYVIADYGTGIVNASAHDARDFAFAKKYNIPLNPVMFPSDPAHAERIKNLEEAYCKDPEGVLQEPEQFRGRKWGEAREEIIDYIAENGFGERSIQYKLRDWSVSRQRYWGCPIPIVYDPEGKAHAVPKEHLPWTLPTDVDFTPTGVAPLAKSEELKKRVVDIFGEGWTPEVETLDTFVDSSWYFLRFADPYNEEVFASEAKMDAWMPVDFYSGGAEHTTMHLLYSRFFTKALYDLGLVKDVEPYTERLNRGIILGTDGNKMSKSKGNVLNPDEFVSRLGADTVRMYLAFIGPYNEVGSYPWNMDSVAGVRRFLERVWSLGTNDFVDSLAPDVEKQLHKTIKAVGESLATRKLNTGIASMMAFLNSVEKTGITQDAMSTFLQLLAPYAPHIAEELWNVLDGEGSVSMAAWPEFDEMMMQETESTIVVQVNGKIRGDFTVAVGADEETVKTEAQKVPSVTKWIVGKNIRKVIYVPGKLVSIVLGE